MDQNEVEQALIICAQIDRNADNNDYAIAEAARYPERLYAFPDVDSSWSVTYHSAGASDRLRAIAQGSALKGFTHYLKNDVDGWLTSDEGYEFFNVAAEFGLIASISGGPAWQRELQRVATAFPTVPILCSHLGGVRASSGSTESGLRELLESAATPNIYIKASGFYYGSANSWDFPYTDSVEAFRTIYEAFGAHRICWGSDYPVSGKGRATYRQTLEVVRSHCRFIGDDDMDWILGGTLEALLRNETSTSSSRITSRELKKDS